MITNSEKDNVGRTTSYSFKETSILKGHWSSVLDVIELAGKYEGLICSCSLDKSCRIWLDPRKKDIQFQPELILRGHSLGVTSVLQLADDRICTGSTDGLIKIFDPLKNWTDGQCDKTMRGHRGGINVLKKLSNPYKICSGADDFTVMIWDVLTFKSLCVLQGHTGPVLDVIELRNGMLCSASVDHMLILWVSNAVPSAEDEQGEYHPQHVDQKLVQTKVVPRSLLSKSVAQVDQTYKLHKTLITRGHQGAVNCVIELEDGRLCSCGADKVLRFWDLSRYVCDYTMEGHWASINCVIQLKDGLLCTCSDDRKIKLWHLTNFIKKNISTPNDHCVHTFTAHEGVVKKVIELNRGGLCSCGGDNNVRLWNPVSTTSTTTVTTDGSVPKDDS